MSRSVRTAEPPRTDPLALAWGKAHETARSRFGDDRALSFFTAEPGRALMDALESAPPGSDLGAICEAHLTDPSEPKPSEPTQ